MTEPKIEIFCGNNIEILKKYPDNYFDSIVTDVPYGLSAEPDAVEMLKAWIEHGYYEHESKSGFMGKEWDAFVPQPIFWKEAFRVLKSGGHVASFFGTRTYDIGVLAMRLAGFEVRDCVQWVYGCLSADSEVLTEQGFMSYDQIRKSKKVRIFAYDKNTDTYVLELPEKWNEYNISLLKPLHKNAKRTYPFWKVCQNCQSPYQTFTKEQAVRSKSCCQKCNHIITGNANKGKMPLFKRKGKIIICAVCGKEKWKPDWKRNNGYRL